MVYYVVFERQGNTEVAIEVEADNEYEAYDTAKDALINSIYDSFVTTKKPDDCVVLDEGGEEC